MTTTRRFLRFMRLALTDRSPAPMASPCQRRAAAADRFGRRPRTASMLMPYAGANSDAAH